jgi:hypothetical protein
VKLVGVLAVLSLTSPAWAEGERALSVGLGWATFSAPGKASGNMAPPALSPDVGGSLTVAYERAIGSDLALRAELAGGLFYGGADKGQSNTSYAGLADAGIAFRFDVLKYVPYAFAGLGGLASGGGPIDRGAQVVLSIGGGLDVLASRSKSWGIEARLSSFGGDVTIFTLGARVTSRWGYF